MTTWRATSDRASKGRSRKRSSRAGSGTGSRLAWRRASATGISWPRRRPPGLRLIESFGLVPTSAGARRLVVVILTLLALGQLGEAVMDFAGRWLGLSAHWTEWFDRDLAWGSRALVGMTIFDTVALTPV